MDALCGTHAVFSYLRYELIWIGECSTWDWEEREFFSCWMGSSAHASWRWLIILFRASLLFLIIHLLDLSVTGTGELHLTLTMNLPNSLSILWIFISHVFIFHCKLNNWLRLLHFLRELAVLSLLNSLIDSPWRCAWFWNLFCL